MCDRFCLLAILAALSLAVAVPVSAQTGRVAGVVKDETGEPIRGATVTAENPEAIPSTFTATTDEEGRFSLIGMRAGQWTFTAQAPGHVPSQGRAAIKTLAGNPPIEFTLARGATGPIGGALAGIDTNVLQAELEQADALYDAGKYDEAIAAYRAVIERVPALTVINLQIGNAFRQQQEYDPALAAYEAVLESDPTNEKAKIAIGRTYLEKGDLDAAETTLMAAAEGLGASREVFYTLAEVKFVRGQADEAAKWYGRAIATDPNWGKPLFKLALVALNQGEKIKAAEYLERVIEVDPNSPEAAQAKTVLQQLK